MGTLRSQLAIVAVAVVLSGCSFVNDTLLPTLAGEEPSRTPHRTGEQVSNPAPAAEQNPQPAVSQAPSPPSGSEGPLPPAVFPAPVPPTVSQAPLEPIGSQPTSAGTGTDQAEPATPGAATGTDAGQKVAVPRAEGGIPRPIVVIRFDRPNVDYEQALHGAVNRVLDRRPQATFNVVAVASGLGGVDQVVTNTTTTKRNAESVIRSLTSMGLTADRINRSSTVSAEAQANEVQIFVH
jgi:hypothetical protein